MEKRIRALLIEDSADDAALLARELQHAGYDIEPTRVDTPEALKKALEDEKWDIVFCDYSMPLLKGTDALRMVRARNPDIPYIFVSGTMGEDVAVAAMRAGAHDYIVKGNLKRLVPAVERELREAEHRRESRNMQRSIKENEEQFRSIMENIADMVALVDPDGKRVYNSPSYGPLLGDPESVRGSDSFEEVHPDDRERMRTIFQETVKSGIGQRTEYRLLLKDGTIRYIESQGSVIRDERGAVRHVLVVSRDITEKKRIEEQMLRAQRMESIGTLAGGIAHDLNNVLGPIMMALDILRRKFPSTDSKGILDTLESSARRGSNMVRQVLAFARGVEGERMQLQAKHLVQEMKEIAGETFPKTIDIRTDVAKNLWAISADPTQIHQILLNLCVNARDAMPQGGTIRIEGENVQIDEQYARMNVGAKAGPYVVIRVSDTGTGMPPGVIDKIFEPFFTTKEVGKGTGLGLSTVLSIVRSHGGFINVYSEPGKGTSFKIYIPGLEKAELEFPKEKHEELKAGHGELVLVIDDEASIRQITKETLETYGYAVLTAGDGTEGVALFVENKKRINAVLTDMMMPFMDGSSTIRAIRKIDPRVIIIAATGLAGSADPVMLADLGVRTILQKPYTAQKLLSAIGEALLSTPART